MSKIKKCLLLIIALTAVFTVFFWGTILSVIAEHSFRNICKDCLAASIKAENVKYGDRIVHFENVQIVDKLNPDKIHLVSEEILLYFEPHFFKQEIDLYVTFIDPKMDLSLISPIFTEFLKNKQETYGLFKINSQVQIKNGVLKYQKDGVPQEIYMSCDHDFIDAKELNVKISIDSPNDEQNWVELKGRITEPSIFHVDMEFNQLCCQKLHHILLPVFKSFDSFLIEAGTLTGSLSIEFDEIKNFQVTSDLISKEISFSYKPLNISGTIPYTHLHLYNGNLGAMNLEGASFEMKENDNPLFSLNKMTGQCLFDKTNSFKIDLIGESDHNGQNFDVNLALEKIQDAYFLDLVLDSNSLEKIVLNLKSIGNLKEIKVKNFGFQELTVAQKALRDICPNFDGFQINEGLFDADIKLKTSGEKLEKLKLASFKSNNLKVTFPQYQLQIEADQILASFEVDLLASNYLDDYNGTLLVENGSIKLDHFDLPILTDLKTDLHIEKGKCKPTIIEGSFLGLKGRSHLDLSRNDYLMNFAFEADAKNLIPFFPESKRKPLLQSFKEDGVKISARLKKLVDARTLEDIFSIEAESEIFSKVKGRNETCLFGFELEKMSDDNNYLPKYSLTNGWFKADHLNLEKYIAPLIFQKDQIKLKGYADFEGSFDETKFHVAYNGQHISLENEFFIVETASIKNAGHFFDLVKKTTLGTIPIKDATYFDKNNGLLFTDIHGIYEVSNSKINAPFIEAFSNGIYFSGAQAIEISPKNDDELQVGLQIKTIKGKFSELQHLFSHFNKSAFFLKMPLESDVSLRQEGAFLKCKFDASGCQFEASIQGEISNGSIKSDNFDVSVQDLNVNFEYNHQANDLIFSDMHGTLLVGKPGRVEEYLVAGDRIHFTDYLKSESTFDMWVGDKNRDIIRIVGKTKSKDEGLIEIALNHELSHFGDMHPTSFNCSLKDWSQLEVLNLDFEFKISHLFKDLQRFSRTGFFFLSRSLLKELNELTTACGDVVFHLDYDQQKILFNYSLKGLKVEIGSHKFDLLSLKGTKFDQNWSIEELKLDQLTLAADIVSEENSCKINFLGVQIGSCLLAGLKGEYNKEENAFLTDVHLFEANLDRLHESTALKHFADEFHPKGKFKGTGKLKLKLGKGLFGFQTDLRLNGTLNNFQTMGLDFKDLDHLSCHYESDKGIAFEEIKTALILNKDEPAEIKSVSLDALQVHYEFAEHALFVEGLNFKLEASHLKNLTDLLAKTFKKKITKEVLEIVNESKKTEFFEGTMNLDISKPYYAMHLLLKDGTYRFFNQEHHVKNFAIDFDPCEFKLSTLYNYKGKEFFLDLSSKSANFDYGKLELRDNEEYVVSAASNEIETPDPLDRSLVINWRNHKDTGLAIEACEGSFAGSKMQLYRNPEEPLVSGIFHLSGDFNFDMQRLVSFFPPELATKIKNWQIQKGYSLKGNWSLFDGQDFDLFNSKFKGMLMGADFEFKGYQFQKLEAKVDYCKNQTKIHHLHVDDPCGTLYAEEVHISPKDLGIWKITLPQLKIEDFRPSLIQHASIQLNSQRKSFVITQLDLDAVTGDLFDEKSFKGHGQFSFKNPHKKNFQNTIFAIPAEIISRIGLSLTVLTPVIGTVEYQLLDGKVLLNKFHEVYSEGRLSKFYLATTPYPSYVDFEGNLFMKVRMKQYNLLFKLAELFVVSIEGNLRRPTYSLQKLIKHEPESLVADHP